MVYDFLAAYGFEPHDWIAKPEEISKLLSKSELVLHSHQAQSDAQTSHPAASNDAARAPTEAAQGTY